MLTLFRRPKTRPPTLLKSPAARSAAREPSALLAFLAGEFAAEVAALWPAPHSLFLLAAAPRRHLACLGLVLKSGAAGRALEGSLKLAVRDAAPSAPAGLLRALGRLGETAWTAADYGLLLDRLADPQTAKALNHAEAISPRKVRVLASLPGPVAAAGGGRLILTEDQGALLAECYEGLVRREGEAAAGERARRWALCATPSALFEKIGTDLVPQASRPPHPGTGRLVPLATRKALADAGRRYRNCLAGRLLDDWNHYYEWRGEPGAVVCISRDPLFGWRLDEALGAQNALLPPKTRQAIEVELKAMGVHLGRSAWQLRALVEQASRERFALPPPQEAVDELFGV